MDKEILKTEAREFKDDLIANFQPTITYSGKQIAHIINGLSLKSLTPNKPSKIKKADVFTVKTASKTRPAVVLKVLKNRTVIYCHLTSTENIHCMTPYDNRFFGKGCFSYSFSICTEEYVIENFIGLFDDIKTVNRAIKDLKEFFVNNL